MLFIILLISITATVLFLVWIGLCRQRHRRRGIALRAWTQWERLPAIADPSRRILEAESILDRALRDIGYRGTFGEKLKRMQKMLPNIDAVWQAHKLRNRIAHEPGLHISSSEAAAALAVFEKALGTLFPR